MKKIIMLQLVLLFSINNLFANPELPLFYKNRDGDIEKEIATVSKKADKMIPDVFSKFKKDPTFLKSLEDCITAFEKNVEKAWLTSSKFFSLVKKDPGIIKHKARAGYIVTSEFISKVAKEPKFIQDKMYELYDQGLEFVNRHQIFTKMVGAVIIFSATRHILKKIKRKASK